MKNFNLEILLGPLAKFFSLLFLLLLPIRSALVAVFVLIVADLIFGVWASIKESKPITSNGFRRTLVKILTYESAILMAFILETYLLDGLPIVKVITGLVGITEGKSFFENIRRITGIDFWSEAISKLNLKDIKNPMDENK